MRPPSRIRDRGSAAGLAALVFAALSACGGGGGGGVGRSSGPPISVTVSADQATVQPGATAQVTAAVSNDADNRGVTWTVSCSSADCGAVSPGATASGIATTYTAPANRPPSALPVSITATSVSNSAVGASTTVTVAGGKAISIAPAGGTTVAGGASAAFTATVVNGPANSAVNWTLSCSLTPCGTVSPASTASGAPTTYTAPPTPLGYDLGVTLTATAAADATLSVSTTIDVPGLTVSIVPSATVRLVAGTTQQYTATVNNDAANQGASWTLQCSAADCGSVSPSAAASGVAVTYTAPATPPPSDLQVRLMATSVSAPSVRSSVALVVETVSVGITPVSVLLPLNLTQPFTGGVAADPTGGGITWTLVQNGSPCLPACGTISSGMTANGMPITYTAPAAIPPDAAVTLTATSVTDPTQSATATVTLTTGTVRLVPADLNFIKIRRGPTITPPGPLTATLTNTGNSPLTITGVALGGTNAGAYTQTNTCGSGLAAGASCDITVQVHAGSCSGGYCTALLSISDSSSDSPQQLHLTMTTRSQVSAAMRTALASHSTISAPPPSGGRSVGTRLAHLIDAKRPDPYLSNGTGRELMLRFWYPAAPSSSCIAAEYTSPQVWSDFSARVGVPLPQVSTHSCLNAPIAAGAHPVVVFTHGFTGTFTDYTFLAEDLASRGYLVASVNHTYEATAVEFPDGRLERSVFGSHLTDDLRSDAGALARAVSARLGDVRFVLDELERLNSLAGGDFAGRLDLSRTALAGHSLGGLTVLRALEMEPRLKAGVVLDGIVPPHLGMPLHQAVLMLTAGRERWNEDDCRLWDALRGPRLAVNLPGAEHLALSDAVWLVKGIVRTGDAKPDRAISAIRDYVASFLDANLSGAESESRTGGRLPAYAGATVATQSESLCLQQSAGQPSGR